MTGLNSNGSRKVFHSLSNWISPGLAAIPAPTRPPINAWVVEIGNPARVRPPHGGKALEVVVRAVSECEE
jgi:hypothetical protein